MISSARESRSFRIWIVMIEWAVDSQVDIIEADQEEEMEVSVVTIASEEVGTMAEAPVVTTMVVAKERTTMIKAEEVMVRDLEEASIILAKKLLFTINLTLEATTANQGASNKARATTTMRMTITL